MCNLADNRCYSDPPPGVDAKPPNIDGTLPVICTPRRLLAGGIAVEQQGWSIERVGTGTVTYAQGVTTLTTSNNGRQLLVLRNVFPPTQWAIVIAGEVIQAGGHTPSNASIALMSSFTDPTGTDGERARMIFVDEAAWGFGAGGTSIGTNMKLPSTYRLERTAGGGLKASVTTTGTSSVSTGSFTSNGTIAVGDQTTEMGLDSTFRITSIDLECP